MRSEPYSTQSVSPQPLSFFRILGRLCLFLLWVFVFACNMALYGWDRLAWKLFRADQRSQFVRRGACARTGLCCQTLGIELPESWLRRPRVLAICRAWYAKVHNFQTLGPPQGRLLPLSCGYFRDGKVCAIYPFRPRLCREYPQLSLFGRVELHRGCGFWFVARGDLGTFEESLAGRKHEIERREFLKEGEGQGPA